MTEAAVSNSFFQPGEAKCAVYKRTRDSTERHHTLGRANIEQLWKNGAPYVDRCASSKAAGNMPAVWWELYLADLLLRLNKRPVPRVSRVPRNEGPDLLLETPRVWIEAIMPEGDEALDPQPPGVGYEVPGDAYLLRLTGAFETKAQQFSKYRARGYTKDTDATIIAISAAKLNYRFNDLPTPRIVSAVLPAGYPTLLVDPQTREITDEFLSYRESISKRETIPVRTDPFLRPEYAHISAVLYSPCDWITPDDADLILVHNPLAQVRLPRAWLGVGREYWLEDSTLNHATYVGDNQQD